MRINEFRGWFQEAGIQFHRRNEVCGNNILYSDDFLSAVGRIIAADHETVIIQYEETGMQIVGRKRLLRVYVYDEETWRYGGGFSRLVRRFIEYLDR